jgi:hypothetical protein
MGEDSHVVTLFWAVTPHNLIGLLLRFEQKPHASILRHKHKSYSMRMVWI